jgi:hypothetical protein
VFLLIDFLVTGFIAGYLFTRVFLQHVFYRADTPPLPPEARAPDKQPDVIPNPSSSSPPASPEVLAPRQS